MSYKYLEHGADIGLEAKSPTREGVFKEAGRALFSLMVDLSEVESRESIRLRVKGSTPEDLLYEWLSELVSLSNLRNQVYGEFPELRIERANSQFILEGVASGENIDPEQRGLGTEVKAVTYQGLKLKDEGGFWKCRFVVDV